MLRYEIVSHLTDASRRGPSLGYCSGALFRDLDRVHEIFCDFQSSRKRDAVFLYLDAVYGLVEWWTAVGREVSRARQALRTKGIKAPLEIEPFAAVIIATACPTKLDKRTVSKWSRLMRYAAKYKRRSESLGAFVARKGGINECTKLFARRLGRSDV